ncbi:uncharacterized protein NPIL_584431 [Nephila pilipes]|uniref:Uncharacterized protein n=1 Tax=Nephila pilipes TaxID=299642 RepID=A0A8X6SYQ0_NEPPI|nr:uncharacterized protein NPIL_584431 [Nephila pilipes]
MENIWTSLLSQEIDQADNPYLTFETLFLRLLKRTAPAFHLPWSHVLDVARQAPCLMNVSLHQDLHLLWKRWTKSVTLDEQHCVERILGRDHVRPSDLTKLVSILFKVAESRQVHAFFAGDGYLGDDPKKYIDAFRYEDEDFRAKHVRGVRILYHFTVVETPQECWVLLDSIFEGTWATPHVRDMYVECVGCEVTDIAEWLPEQQEKTTTRTDNRLPKSW